MTITEAHAVNRLAGYLLAEPDVLGARVTHQEARKALSTLAKSAAKALYAGVTPERVEAAWGDAASAPVLREIPRP